MKKLLSVLLVMAMVIAVIPAGVIVASAEQEGDYTYSVANSKATITKYTGTGGDITIPSTLGVYPVTVIGNYAFIDCIGLTSVSIPVSVTRIGSSAFNRCTNLSIVDIPQSVTTIDDYAFANCIGLTTVPIGTGVTTLGERAFWNCNGFNTVFIPSYVIKIGAAAFGSCKNLSQITVAASNEFYSSLNGVLFNKEKTTIIQYPIIKPDTSYDIQDGVIAVENYAFYGCSTLKSVTIPNSVTKIGLSAFHNCSGLTTITIGNSVSIIGESAFANCSNLTSLDLPDWTCQERWRRKTPKI